MVLKYLRYLVFSTPEGRKKREERREKQSKLEAELEFLARLSAKAKSSSNYGSYSKPCKETSGEHPVYW